MYAHLTAIEVYKYLIINCLVKNTLDILSNLSIHPSPRVNGHAQWAGAHKEQWMKTRNYDWLIAV